MKLSYPVDDDEVGSDDEEERESQSRQVGETLGKFCRFVAFHGIEPD